MPKKTPKLPVGSTNEGLLYCVRETKLIPNRPTREDLLEQMAVSAERCLAVSQQMGHVERWVAAYAQKTGKRFHLQFGEGFGEVEIFRVA